MKVYWLKSVVGAGLIFSLGMASADQEAASPERLLSRKEVRLLAEKTEEARALYQLNNGRYFKCIEVSVEEPCESDWVTCIEDAYVVKFRLGEPCGLKHDGRVGLTFLIDRRTAQIISKYPEADYFNNARHCLNNDDCVLRHDQENGIGECLNFIHGQEHRQAVEQIQYDSLDCRCLDMLCTYER
jgi:hypothetical protein